MGYLDSDEFYEVVRVYTGVPNGGKPFRLCGLLIVAEDIYESEEPIVLSMANHKAMYMVGLRWVDMAIPTTESILGMPLVVYVKSLYTSPAFHEPLSHILYKRVVQDMDGRVISAKLNGVVNAD